MGATKKETLRRSLSDVLRDLSEKEPLVAGPMFKQSRKFAATLHKRYFVLYEGYLLYYPHEKSYKKDTRLVSNSDPYLLSGLPH